LVQAKQKSKNPTQSPVELRTWLRLARSFRIVEREMSRRMRLRYGHGMSRFDVLSQLARIDHKWVTVGVLSKQLLAEHSGITRLIDRMIEDGLVNRRSNPNDRRSYQISLTAEGRRHFNSVVDDHARWSKSIFGPLGTDSCAELNLLLDDLVSKCQQELSEHESIV